MTDLLFAAAVVLAAAAACLTSDRTRSAVSFLVFGALLSLWWASAGAPDVALAEAALGTGVTGALFIDALTRSRVGLRAAPGTPAVRRPSARTGLLRSLGVLAVAVIVAGGVARAILALAAPVPEDDRAAGLGDLLRAQGEVLGAEHEITAVLLHVRAYDTLLEAAVLLAAAITVLAISEATRPAPRPAAGWGDQRAGTREVPAYVRFFAVTVTPLLVLLAAWILFAGTSRTGGAFQAGALLAGTWIMLHLAGSSPVRWAGRSMNALLVAGVSAFLVAAVAGVALRGSWLSLDPAWSGVAIIGVETALTLAVAASLAVAFMALGRDPGGPDGSGDSHDPGSEAPAEARADGTVRSDERGVSRS